MTDAETAETVGSWEDGQSYSITMVDSKAGIGEYQEEGAEEQAEAAPGAAPGPAAIKAALGGGAAGPGG